ncbi:MAG TPA: FAD-binding oxidoreductase [Rhizobiaceae bacterium]|nr:FAD-binding oxidoreductase [Rhizobiaceae bacterium]
MVTAAYQSFGRVNRPASKVLDAAAAMKLLQSRNAKPNSLLGFGNGKSYGDSCLNESGSVVDMRPMNRILGFDPVTGMIEAEAGALLSEIIAYTAPHGWFPAVVPGTQFVTLGGAIANDVHGKNHHRRGTFGRHVDSFTLLGSDGRTRRCAATIEPRLFEATIGGMGLTGLILTATVRLMKVSSLDVEERVTRFRNLDEYFALAPRADEDNEYAVAWVDQLAGGKGFGRGLLLTGNHAPGGGKTVQAAGGLLSVPFQPPVTVLNRPFLKLFNAAYRFGKGRHRAPRRSSYQSFFFPLDGVRDWNLLYGPKGLFQHQSAVPEEAARTAVPAMLEAARRAGQGSFLTVLKRFGALRSPGFISFPRPGYTLTLDFPNRGQTTLDLLAELDRITVAAGGAVNPYKDARMSPQTFAAWFPDWRLLEAARDPAFQSDFWMRTAMRLVSKDAMPAAAE